MHVRALIASRPDWLEHLVGEKKIHAVTDGDLVSLKYNQIESPMDDPVVQECRGMVVHVPTGTILAHPFNKFWNHGEHLAAPIDWSSAHVLEKLDGSLMVLYWDYHTGALGGWAVASSGHPTAGGSFGASDKTFRDGFWEIWRDSGMLLPEAIDHNDGGFEYRRITFMFELCAAENRVVVRHERPRIVLLAARDLATGKELDRGRLHLIASRHNWEIVGMRAIDTVAGVLAAAEKLDPINAEGFVVVDKEFRRVKIKSPRYVILHHMKGEATPRRAIELWQTGETGELLGHFPEMAPQILPIQEKLDRAADCAFQDIVRYAATPTRKEYAEIVKERPWSALCFRFYGKPLPSLDVVKAEMRAQTTASLERLVERFEQGFWRKGGLFG